jgi:creatinine amidohydrolase/Fe(II)-dependent formamide hydrolase-like protein
VRARLVVPALLGQGLGLAQDDPRFIATACPRSELREFADLHAGEAETSAMLHIAPDGYVSAPALASPEKGRRQLETEVAEAIRKAATAGR